MSMVNVYYLIPMEMMFIKLVNLTVFIKQVLV